MEELLNYGTFCVSSRQRERFASGELWQQWGSAYPFLFDEDDLRLVKNQADGGYHFYEWLAAILIYHSTGYLSLIEKYQSENHKHKKEILRAINSPLLNHALLLRDNDRAVVCPDLLVYSPDFSDWFFCEVKGGKDRVRKTQEQDHRALYNLIRRPIRLIYFKTLER